MQLFQKKTWISSFVLFFLLITQFFLPVSQIPVSISQADYEINSDAKVLTLDTYVPEQADICSAEQLSRLSSEVVRAFRVIRFSESLKKHLGGRVFLCHSTFYSSPIHFIENRFFLEEAVFVSYLFVLLDYLHQQDGDKIH